MLAQVLSESLEFSRASVGQVERIQNAGVRKFQTRADRGETYSSDDFPRVQEYADEVYAQEGELEIFENRDESDSFARQGASDSAKVEIFREDSPEFVAAVKKLSPELLRLLKSQFECEPSLLIRRPEIEVEIISNESILDNERAFSDEMESEDL